MSRGDNTPARDSTIIMNNEADLAPITLDTTNRTASIDLTASSASFVQSPLVGTPLILELQGNGVFYEGQAAPDAAKNVQRFGNTPYSRPVNGRGIWYLAWGGSGTVVIKGKLQLAK